MYCPRCAKQELEGTKFCRVCGINLETVALALDGKLVPPNMPSQGGGAHSHSWDVHAPNRGWEDKYNNPQTIEDWLRKLSAGVNFLARGATLLGAALMAGGILLSLFGASAWMLIVWAILFGWMSMWGIGWVAEGFGAILQSRSILRRKDLLGLKRAADSASAQVSDTSDLSRLPAATITPDLPPPLSITENTTAPLGKQ